MANDQATLTADSNRNLMLQVADLGNRVNALAMQAHAIDEDIAGILESLAPPGMTDAESDAYWAAFTRERVSNARPTMTSGGWT